MVSPASPRVRDLAEMVRQLPPAVGCAGMFGSGLEEADSKAKKPPAAAPASSATGQKQPAGWVPGGGVGPSKGPDGYTAIGEEDAFTLGDEVGEESPRRGEGLVAEGAPDDAASTIGAGGDGGGTRGGLERGSEPVKRLFF